MSYYFSKKLNLPFEEVETKIVEELKKMNSELLQK